MTTALPSVGASGINGWFVSRVPQRNRTDTRPFEPDSDDDGAWDGWLGVHGVGYSDNVILYEANLFRTGSIDGDDIVQEQVGIHRVSPSEPGTDLYGNGMRFHSNVHVGERQWATDPEDSTGSETPRPRVAVEADYHSQANQTLLGIRDDWETSIERNYALYGINVTFVDDSHTQVLSASQLSTATVSPPFDWQDLNDTRTRFANTSALYMVVGRQAEDTPNPNDTFFATQSGTTGWDTYRQDAAYVAVFTHGNTQPQDDIGEVPGRLGLSTRGKVSAIARKSAVHELGHVLGTGETDESGDEVYSGENSDYSLETVEDFGQAFDPAVTEWSVMSGGTELDQFLPSSNETYFAFSLEELLTVSTNDGTVGK
jgi:hypothetical protein